MGIFDSFNNQGLSNEKAFEELCCQLFELWGTREIVHVDSWEYRKIRGEGGDGGIEAYWRRIDGDDWICIQAKWFLATLTSSNYSQIKKSIETAMSMRPSMRRYIICIPHNLTSKKKGAASKAVVGEDEKWSSFIQKIKVDYPNVIFDLWDESEICKQLGMPESEGVWRFWFTHSVVNRESVALGVEKAVASLGSRYIPDLVCAGAISRFLDGFFGTIEARADLRKGLDACRTVCAKLKTALMSFRECPGEGRGGAETSAVKCLATISGYLKAIESRIELVESEPLSFVEIPPYQVDYEAIEEFSYALNDLKRSRDLSGHIRVLVDLIDELKEVDNGWEVMRALEDGFSSAHCFVIGEQGTGKTCGFIDKARDYCTSGRHLPLFVNASDMRGADWATAARRALGLGSDWDESALWQALSASAAISDESKDGISVRSKVAIFVDGLDEVPDKSMWEKLIGQADAIASRYPRIRFAFSSRPNGVVFARGTELLRCSFHLKYTGDVPVCDLFDRYISFYNISLSGGNRFKWLLRTPSELKAFCIAYRDRRVPDETSVCVSDLINAEIKRLEEEFKTLVELPEGRPDEPVRASLLSLAEAFLEDESPRTRREVFSLIDGILCDGEKSSLVGFLANYGILLPMEERGENPFSPCTIHYSRGNRHLWDYLVAFLAVSKGFVPFGDDDSLEMYSILLLEQKGMLPLEDPIVVDAVGEEGAYELTLLALANCRRDAAAEHTEWVKGELDGGRDKIAAIVSKLIIRVADEKCDALGPEILDEYLRTFESPIERDLAWSLPAGLDEKGSYAIYRERDSVRQMPRLHPGARHNQMPLVFAWRLSSLSNPRRTHCRRELLRWGMSDPSEFASLFGRFCDCNDPQIREDMFALAEEIVISGNASPEAKDEILTCINRSLFVRSDAPGNRDAVLRHYGRLALGQSACSLEQLACSSPFSNGCAGGFPAAMPVHVDACKKGRPTGYGPIGYDLARYVLVEILESAFENMPSCDGTSLRLKIMEDSAAACGIKPPSFEVWIVAAAFQYLVNCGYDRDAIEGKIGNHGYRVGGVDGKIRAAFGIADHGAKSEVMSIAEKYVWCARNEICGYLADCTLAQVDECGSEKSAIATTTVDYGLLLDMDSPLFEETAIGLEEKRGTIQPKFPDAFSCCAGKEILQKDELTEWVNEPPNAAINSLIECQQSIELGLDGDAIPISLYAFDWNLNGRESSAWLYGGVAERTEVEKIKKMKLLRFSGLGRVSDFGAGLYIPSLACYVSPVELAANEWAFECDETDLPVGEDGLEVNAQPLSGYAANRMMESGDYWYRFPSVYARRLCDTVRNDGARYYGKDGRVVFEDVRIGERYRHEYQALLADRAMLLEAVANDNCCLIWFATLRRGGNELARERMTCDIDSVESTALVWMNDDGSFGLIPISQEEGLGTSSGDMKAVGQIKKAVSAEARASETIIDDAYSGLLDAIP